MKTVIEMAREAGARPQQNKNCDVEYLMDAEALERFAELVRADEREACAKVCDEHYFQNYPDAEEWERSEEGEAIRARSQQ